MVDAPFNATHAAEHRLAAKRSLLQPAATDLIRVGSRRWFLQAGLAGVAGLSLPQLLRARANAAPPVANAPGSPKSVILFWLSGGPSHLDTWDPKPEAPVEVRGPFESISTKVPGLRFCEHLPLQAGIADRLAVLRAVDCRASDDHHPAVMQSGNILALKDLKATIGPRVGKYPSMGSVAARFRGANDPAMPAFVGMADQGLWHADVWGAGHLGTEYEPIAETDLSGRLEMPKAINVARAQDRDALLRQFDRLRSDVGSSQTMSRMDHYSRQALAMTLSPKAREALRIDQEKDTLRDAYGRDSFGEKALLARRLVEAGVTFVTVSGRFGVFDNHGDDVVWGGLIKGLKPLFPSIDRSLSALVLDLQSRGLLDDTLVLMLGEFGRSPVISATGGRTHWSNCMSMLMAGGRIPRGQAIGSTDSQGYDLKDGRVTPADIAATVFRHLAIDPTSQWTDHQGRPHFIVGEGAQELEVRG